MHLDNCIRTDTSGPGEPAGIRESGERAGHARIRESGERASGESIRPKKLEFEGHLHF